MTNFCSNCGTRLVPGESFCHHCGAKVMQTNPAPARPVSQQNPNGAPRQVQQPIRQPQRHPMQPVPNQQPQNRDRPPQPTGKEHSNAMIVLTIILAVVLVVEGLVAGLWFPGFFHVGKRLFGSGRVDVQQGKTHASFAAEKYRSNGDLSFSLYNCADRPDAPDFGKPEISKPKS